MNTASQPIAASEKQGGELVFVDDHEQPVGELVAKNKAFDHKKQSTIHAQKRVIPKGAPQQRERMQDESARTTVTSTKSYFVVHRGF